MLSPWTAVVDQIFQTRASGTWCVEPDDAVWASQVVDARVSGLAGWITVIGRLQFMSRHQTLIVMEKFVEKTFCNHMHKQNICSVHCVWQIHYAALDALVAVHIFLALIEMRYGIKRCNDEDQDATLMKKVLSVCQGLTDAKYSTKASTIKNEANVGKKVCAPTDSIVYPQCFRLIFVRVFLMHLNLWFLVWSHLHDYFVLLLDLINVDFMLCYGEWVERLVMFFEYVVDVECRM